MQPAHREWMIRALTCLRSPFLSIALTHIWFASDLMNHPRTTCFVCHTFVAYEMWECFCCCCSVFATLKLYTNITEWDASGYTLVIVFDTRFKNRISIRWIFIDFNHAALSLLHKVKLCPHLPLVIKMIKMHRKFRNWNVLHAKKKRIQIHES